MDVSNDILLLKSHVTFLEEKLEVLEKNTGPIYHLIPVRVHDLCLIEGQKKGEDFYLLAVLHDKKATRTNVIKVPRDVIQLLADSDDLVTIDNFMITENMAEKRLYNKRWVWKLII